MLTVGQQAELTAINGLIEFLVERRRKLLEEDEAVTRCYTCDSVEPCVHIQRNVNDGIWRQGQ